MAAMADRASVRSIQRRNERARLLTGALELDLAEGPRLLTGALELEEEREELGDIEIWGDRVWFVPFWVAPGFTCSVAHCCASIVPPSLSRPLLSPHPSRTYINVQ